MAASSSSIRLRCVSTASNAYSSRPIGPLTRAPPPVLLSARSRGGRVLRRSAGEPRPSPRSEGLRPCVPARAENRPQTRASAAPKGTIRSANTVSVSASQRAAESLRTAGPFRACISIPRSISPSVTTLRNSSLSRGHSATLPPPAPCAAAVPRIPHLCRAGTSQNITSCGVTFARGASVPSAGRADARRRSAVSLRPRSACVVFRRNDHHCRMAPSETYWGRPLECCRHHHAEAVLAV